MKYFPGFCGLALLLLSPALGQMRIIPHVTRAGGDFTSQILLTANSSESVSYSLTAYAENGVVSGRSNGVLAGGATVVSAVEDFFSGEVGYLVLEGNPDLTLAVRFRANKEDVSAVEVKDSSESSSIWRVFAGNPAVTWDGLAVVNMGDAPTDITLYEVAGTSVVPSQPETLQGLGPAVKGLHILSRTLPGDDHFFELVADQPLALLALRGNLASDFLWQNSAIARSSPFVEPDSIETGVLPPKLPPFASLALYSESSPWNTVIGEDPAIDENSELMVRSLVAAGGLTVQVGQYSAPVYFADDDTPRHDVLLHCGDFWEIGINTLVSVPIPDWAEPAFDRDGSTTPVGCGEESDQDNMMVILDVANRCEYNFWQARRENEQWSASWGNRISMDSEGVFPHGLSARGSGFAFLGGLIWPDELTTGRIEHALCFSYPYPKAGGPVAPASDSDGTSTEAFAIPEGARIQLDPSLDLDSLNLSGYERTIAEALQTYGMILVDSGGEPDADSIGLYAIDPKSTTSNPYTNSWGEGDFIRLPGISPEHFRILMLGSQNADYQEQLELDDASPCSGFR